ncbi:MAG: RNA polymerase sigma factor [Deltaproteobacteria bacterium]
MNNSSRRENVSVGESGALTYSGARKGIGELSDEELAKSFAQNRGEEQFGEIVNRYSDKIYRLAYRITQSQGDAEEVLQEVFITLMKNMGKFRSESKFGTWLYRVALNTTYLYIRSGRKRQDREISLENYGSGDNRSDVLSVEFGHRQDAADRELLSREALETLERAVNELPEAYRVVFQLRDVEELSNERVAEILGISIANVKSRIHRARLSLRDKLSGYFYERAA